MFVRTDGNDPADKESLMIIMRKDKARVKSVNKRGHNLVLKWKDCLKKEHRQSPIF